MCTVRTAGGKAAQSSPNDTRKVRERLSVFHISEGWSLGELMAIGFLSNGAAVLLRNRYDSGGERAASSTR
jgi:hypothetical protein